MLVLAENAGSIHALAYSPDCRFLASGTRGGEIQVWNLSSGECDRHLHLPEELILSLAFAPDGLTVALATSHMVSLWDMERDLVHDYPRPRGGSCALTFLAGNPSLLIMSGYMDNTLTLLDWQQDLGKVTSERLSEGILCLAGAPGGTLFASGGGNVRGDLLVWERPGVVRHRLRGHERPIYSLAFSPAGDRLASAGRDGSIRVWDPVAGREILSLTDTPGTIVGLAFTQDGQTLVSASSQGLIRLWDAETGRQRGELDWKIGGVRCLALAPDGMTAAVAGSAPGIMIWDIE